MPVRSLPHLVWLQVALEGVQYVQFRLMLRLFDFRVRPTVDGQNCCRTNSRCNNYPTAVHPIASAASSSGMTCVSFHLECLAYLLCKPPFRSCYIRSKLLEMGRISLLPPESRRIRHT